MCGICGFAGFRDNEYLNRMTRQLVHRGPDDEGFYVDEQVSLGMRRLSIIDVQGGHQPIHNEDMTVWVVFNGEIYNFIELREELAKKGHAFYTKTDTGVIVHLYEEFGEDCVHHLRGMFAFALWDKGRSRLLLARDRLGKKPLFYAFDGQTFRFASEIKAILTDGISKELDLLAVHFYLTYRYIPHPYTVFQSIRKLPPAHLLLLEGGKMRIEPYWQLTSSPLTQRNEEALCEEVVERLRKAVRSRMISDVSLGAFLSGGINSSAVVALMTEASITPVRTFSIGFEGDGDDLDRARMVAQAFGTEHHELVVKPDSPSLLPWLVRHLDEPFADPSIIPTFYLAQFAREHVTVALNGDGGDETFAGYSKYWQDRAAAWLGALPNAIHDGLLQGAIALLKGLAPESGRVESLEEICQSASLTPPARYAFLSEALEDTAILSANQTPDSILIEVFINI